MPLDTKPENLAMVVGYYPGESVFDEACYGPYLRPYAETVAKELSEGGWHHVQWKALPIKRMPGESQRPPGPVYRGGVEAATEALFGSFGPPDRRTSQ